MIPDSVSVSSSSQSAETSSPPPILVSCLVARVGGMTVRYPPTDRSNRSVKGGEVSLYRKKICLELTSQTVRLESIFGANSPALEIKQQQQHKEALKSNRTRKQPP